MNSSRPGSSRPFLRPLRLRELGSPAGSQKNLRFCLSQNTRFLLALPLRRKSRKAPTSLSRFFLIGTHFLVVGDTFPQGFPTPACAPLIFVHIAGLSYCNKSHYENVPFEVPEGWCWTTLGEIGTWQAGGTPSRMHKEYYGGSIPWLKTGDLNDGFITTVPEYITEEGLNNSSAKLNPAGSVLIAMYGATIGKVGILGIPATTNQACCACVDYNGIIQKYLFYFLLSHKEKFIALGGGGAQPNISKEIITKTPIPIPPMEEQLRIVEKIEKLYSQLDMIKESLQA